MTGVRVPHSTHLVTWNRVSTQFHSHNMHNRVETKVSFCTKADSDRTKCNVYTVKLFILTTLVFDRSLGYSFPSFNASDINPFVLHIKAYEPEYWQPFNLVKNVLNKNCQIRGLTILKVIYIYTYTYIYGQ